MSYLDDLFSLEGLNAVVTGGSSGIGRGIATALAGAGASVHLVARDAEKLATVAAEIGATWEVCDVGDAKRAVEPG